jgi:hypothetical protein
VAPLWPRADESSATASVLSVSDEEAETIRAFIEEPVRRRMLTLLGSSRRRRDLVAMLDHLDSFDQRWTVPLKPSEQTPEQIGAELVSRGTGQECSVMSSASRLDGRRVLLGEALDAVVGFGHGSLLICVRGRLAFYEGEEPRRRMILHRTSASYSTSMSCRTIDTE